MPWGSVAPGMGAGTGLRDGGAFPIPSPTGSRARAEPEHLRRRRQRKQRAQGQHCMTLLLLTPTGRVGTSVPREPRWELLAEGSPSWVLLLGAVPGDKARLILWGAGRVCLLWWGCWQQSGRSLLSGPAVPQSWGSARAGSWAGSGAELLSPVLKQRQSGTALLERAGPM